MGYKGYEYQSDFAKKHFAEGRAAGFAEGRAAAIAEARAAGVAEGHTEGLRIALLSFLAAKRLEPNDEELRCIHDCHDTTVLQSWLERALDATTVANVLDR